jgi:hypothetical protein
MVPPTSSGMRPRADLGHGGQRVGAEARRRVGIGRVADVDQPMRIARQHRRRRLGGADVHAAVDQRRVDADRSRSAGSASASASARSVLPEAVGPISRIAGRQRSRRAAPSSVRGSTAPRHRLRISAPAQEQPSSSRVGQRVQVGPAVVALVRALGALHVPQQRVHLLERQAPVGAHGAMAGHAGEQTALPMAARCGRCCPGWPGPPAHRAAAARIGPASSAGSSRTTSRSRRGDRRRAEPVEQLRAAPRPGPPRRG